MKTCKAVKITDSVYWVGAIDWEIRNFHGYATGRGTTYNAYLVMADRIALVDTVKAPFVEELLARIGSVVDPERIECIISNHSEMDHTGGLLRVMDVVKPSAVYASRKGAETIEAHFGLKQIEAVRDGGTIDLGDRTVTCMETRLLHWPDSMISYLDPDRILFSQDGFGMHLASNERFDDQIDDYVLYHEAAKYYANILLPYSHIAAKAVRRIDESGLAIELIAPDHGPVWRSKVPWILDLYRAWSARTLSRKAVIVFDTMWGSTRTMARSIEDGLTEGGVHARVFNASTTDRAAIATELIDAAALVVGSPTLNNSVFPTIADVLAYIGGLAPKGLVGAAFGSYGWSGEAVRALSAQLEQMKIEQIDEGLRVNYVPKPDDLERCRALGLKVAERIQHLPDPLPMMRV